MAYPMQIPRKIPLSLCAAHIIHTTNIYLSIPGGTDFNDFQIEDAAQRGVANRNGPHPGGYPKDFHNTEGFKFSNCDGQLQEFPILEGGNVYGGGRPHGFRVIYQLTDGNNGKYCGVLYHPVGPSLIEQYF